MGKRVIYRITYKYNLCSSLNDCREHSIHNCLKCKEANIQGETTEDYTLEEYLGLLNKGNVYITKVEAIEK